VKVILSWVRHDLMDVNVIWHLDTIAVFGRSPQQVEQATATLILFLMSLGVEVNAGKGMKAAAMRFKYLGQLIRKPTTN